MREEERIQNGWLFDPADAELVRLKERAHNLNRVYNSLADSDEARQECLEKLLGKIGKNCLLQGPVYFHYGIHTQIGDLFFASFNFTVQDDAAVTIGNNCDFGPLCDDCDARAPHVAAGAQGDAQAKRGRPSAVLCLAGSHRERLLDLRKYSGVLRRDDWRRLRHRCGQRCGARYPRALVCRWQPLPLSARSRRRRRLPTRKRFLPAVACSKGRAAALF